MRYIFLFVFFAVPLEFLVSSCTSTIMLRDGPTTKAEILKHVPFGTSISQARSFMETNGFKCTYIKHERYGDDIDAQGTQITRGPANILWCDSGERATWRILISKRWQVCFEDTGDKVSYVAVGVGVTGP